MSEQKSGFPTDRAREIGERIGIDWDRSRFTSSSSGWGSGSSSSMAAATRRDDDQLTTGKIARAHLNEFPDYYTRLAEMEAEAEQYWAERET